jgi:hypothetical protein
MIAERAIMRHMRLGEQRAAAANSRDSAASCRSEMDRHAFTNEAIRADDQRALIATRFEILRRRPEGHERENACIGADFRLARNDDMRDELHILAKPRIRADMAKRPHHASGGQRGPRFNVGERMDPYAELQATSRGAYTPTMALICASQTNAPSTSALPEYQKMFRFCVTLVICNSSRSPGPTGLRNFALSIVTK